MSRCLLDASALLCWLHKEKGADKVDAVLDEAAISAVNLAETYGKLLESGMPAAEIEAIFVELELEIFPFEQAIAYVTGQLRPLTRAFGLSLGDRACLATAKQYGLPVLTTDTPWKDVDIGVEIICVR